MVLRINMAQTIDGHTIDFNGLWNYGSSEDKRRMDKLREWSQCIIGSRRSIENDNPNLYIRRKKDHPFHPYPVLIMYNINKKIKADRRVFFPPHPPGEIWVQSQENVVWKDIVESGIQTDQVSSAWKVFNFQSTKEIYNSLSNRGFKNILLEGGPELNGLFMKDDLIDEIFLTIVPYLWAGKTTDRIITSDIYFGKRFKLLSCERKKNELFLHYKRLQIK